MTFKHSGGMGTAIPVCVKKINNVKLLSGQTVMFPYLQYRLLFSCCCFDIQLPYQSITKRYSLHQSAVAAVELQHKQGRLSVKFPERRAADLMLDV